MTDIPLKNAGPENIVELSIEEIENVSGGLAPLAWLGVVVAVHLASEIFHHH